jgi:multidrug efflux pump subunit AcrB
MIRIVLLGSLILTANVLASGDSKPTSTSAPPPAVSVSQPLQKSITEWDEYTGRFTPSGAVATFRDITGPYRVPRYNLFPAAEVQGSTLPGFSTGQAIAAMQRIAAENLPSGFGYEWTEAGAGDGAGAKMRQALGTAVFFGMLGVTMFGLLFTPVFYVLVRWIGSLRHVPSG